MVKGIEQHVTTSQAGVDPTAPRNISTIYDKTDAEFLSKSVGQVLGEGATLVIANDPLFLSHLAHQVHSDFGMVGLDDVPISLTNVRARIQQLIEGRTAVSLVIVDMRWGTRTVAAAANFERWGALCDKLVAQDGVTVVSAYSRDLMIDDQLLAAMRSHSHFLAPSGLHGNPYWLPPEYQNGATISQQIGFVLGRLVPDFQGLIVEDNGAASGADPQWLAVPRRLRPRVGKDEIWKIRCFGRLRIYLSDGSQIKWDLPGSAVKKNKALFAFLLQRGEKGAPTDALAEMLWSDEPDETKKRKRLHQAIAMLRKTLGGPEYIRRNGEYYTLVPPDGTWIDVASFEQLCNRAKVLEKSGSFDDAIALLDGADRLYSGPLFEDLSPVYFENEMENWVVPKRAWFKDMALKVLRDKASMLRRQGQYRDAIRNCQKALQIDPICEIAHAEAMHVFHAQNRSDAIRRQYDQFLKAVSALELAPDGDTLEKLKNSLLFSIS